MATVTIEGRITRDGVTTEFEIEESGFYIQWGGTTEELGKNVELLQSIGQAVFSE